MSRRRWLPLALLLSFSGCREAVAPLDEPSVPGVAFRVVGDLPPVLQQSSTAPPLEAYQVSFWVFRNKASSVSVNYQPAAGQSVGQPFLRFDVPRGGLVAGAGGTPLKRSDSVSVTLTIDPASFSVDFQPPGLVFSSRSPANLTIWYGNANLDLNGNGVVDGSDWMLLRQLTFWYEATTESGYKVRSKNDTMQLILSAALYHFSSYAVSW